MDVAERQAALYFALTLLLTVPFWAVGAFVNVELLPGLPLAALAIVAPALAAAALTLGDGGLQGVGNLFKRAVDIRTPGVRLILVALINPLLFALAFVVSRSMGEPVPDPAWSIERALVLFLLFLPTAALEEIGWSGYALDRLQAGRGPVTSGVVLGLAWAAWHYPALIEAGRPLEWIVWWILWTVSARMVMVWVYNWTNGAVFAAVLYHAVSNVCWQLYPVSGSYFDPRISAVLTLGLAFALMLLPRKRARLA